MTRRVLRGAEHPNWKGDAARPTTKRERAKAVHPTLGACDRCGAPATDRHHMDGDTGNNTRENLACLCRRCHMEIDGRLAVIAASDVARRRKGPAPCVQCGTLYKPLRKGLCERCYARGRYRPKTRKLTAADVLAIRAAGPELRSGVLAVRYGVDAGYIARVRYGRAWRKV